MGIAMEMGTVILIKKLNRFILQLNDNKIKHFVTKPKQNIIL